MIGLELVSGFLSVSLVSFHRAEIDNASRKEPAKNRPSPFINDSENSSSGKTNPSSRTLDL